VLREQVQHTQDRLAKVESQMEEGQIHLAEMIERARKDVEVLEDTLNKATRVLTRNSVDFGAEMESVKTRLQEMDGSLAEIRNDLDQFGKSVEATSKKVDDFAMAAGLDVPIDESKVPGTPQDHFAAINTAFKEGRYSEARAFAEIFLKRYPKRAEADDIQLLIAKSYSQQKRWAKALGVLRIFSDSYPNSELLPEGLYEMAEAFFALGDCTDASILIDTITTRHKKSAFAERARELLKEIKKSKSRCTS
jgi:TolA-binding protein